MEKSKLTRLADLPDDSRFYRGTIVVIKDAEITPAGNFDKVYCMIMNSFQRDLFDMLDLYRGMGSCICHTMKPDVPGHMAVSKQGIFDWVQQYFGLFYTPEGYKKWKQRIQDIVYVGDLDNHFTQANRDLFMPNK